MRSKIEVIRALSYVVARRVLAVVAVITLVISILLLAGIWALAYNFSAWWWLLLFIYIPWVVVALFIYATARFIARKIYPWPLSNRQKRILKNFADKIQRLLEARGIDWWMFALQCLKDLLFHRDLTTLKELIADTTSLRRDLETLEQTLTTDRSLLAARRLPNLMSSLTIFHYLFCQRGYSYINIKRKS